MLEQLSRALWSRGTLRGAAVLVGAGVSRGGVELLCSDACPPPLWSHLADEMARDLYGTQLENAPKDPLRLAEEYRAGLGNAALTDFLQRSIRDDTYEPGQIHRDLLELPWADILTTNYDTLLERTAQTTKRRYDLVASESDLAHSVGARIIKLHGSLQDRSDVIISEEDYRTYPDRKAAFVNTARQVFIENELCLLGFSGDDPNFLQWAGWVRDRLGGHARRIYLVGALDLPTVKRRLLEARGVAPIDLGPAVKGERSDRRHAAAISLFLAHLKGARPAGPNDWQATPYQEYRGLRSTDTEAWIHDLRDPDKVVEAFREALAIWRKDRHSYPGWIICSCSVRRSIRNGTDAVDNIALALDTLPEDERRGALLELAWRFDHGAQPLEPWLRERMNAIATADGLAAAEPELIRALARVLLGAARTADDKDAHADYAKRFGSFPTHSDLHALVEHERCLYARDRLDFQFVAENAHKVEGDDPIWGLRRAALLYWVGEADEALRSVGIAVHELRRRTLRDPDSVALRSSLAWAQMITQVVREEDEGVLFSELDGLDRLALRDYTPWDQLGALDAEVDERLRKRMEEREIEPGFEAGTFRDYSNTVTIGSAAQVTPLYELQHIAERAGLPSRTLYANLLGSRFADALRLHFEPTAAWYSAFLSTKPSYSKGLINIHLGRIPVARLGVPALTELRARIENAVSFWGDRVRRGKDVHNDVDSLRLYVEALSRITSRDDAETAKTHVRLAVELGSDEGLNHWWLHEPIGHLLKRAMAAVPRNERSALSNELLRFPLATERGAGDTPMEWYDPAPDYYRFIRRTGNEAIFDARITEFLHHLSGDPPLRREAAVRLLYLHEQGQLKKNQIVQFAEALWKNVPKDSDTLPDGLRLHSHAFLIAPEPKDIDARARVYKHLFAPGEGGSAFDLVAAASGQTPYLQPNKTDAARLFRNVVKWRPEASDSSSIGEVFVQPMLQTQDRMTASVLGIVAAPALADEDRTVERAEAALTFIEETGLTPALAALPVFHGLNKDIDQRILNAFRRALTTGNRNAARDAVHAIDRWLYMSDAGRARSLPKLLRDYVLRELERGRISRLTDFVYLARRLIVSNRCKKPEIERIIDVLDELIQVTEYGPAQRDREIDTDRNIWLPLVRAECVRLALVLKKKGMTTDPICTWCDLAARDPLPEVRDAAYDADVE